MPKELVPQLVTLDTAIALIHRMPNSELYTQLAVLHEAGAKPTPLTPEAEFDEGSLYAQAQAAFNEYPYSSIQLHVKRKNGLLRGEIRLLTKNIFTLIKDSANMGALTIKKSYLPKSESESENAFLPGMSETARIIVQMKQEQLEESRELVKELRDQHKMDQDTIRKLTDENNKLQLDARMREREFEIEKRELEVNKPKGLEGVMQTVQGLPESVTLALISRFLGPAPAPQIQMGAAPMMPGLTANQQALITELNKELSQWDEQQLTKLYAVVIYAKQGQIHLDRVIAQVQHAA
ncbi:hypothetical protein ACFS7Z_13755 [Pontibacter toksunensis]|uniref:Uncharacterized protein n=1 Tax=Pontibacter toksunensis TaxID=1332631 RepID=A0ABW6BWV9_9BACT